MIKSIKPLTMTEVKEIISKLDENDKIKAVSSHIKKFTKLDSADAKKMREEISALNNAKLKEQDIAKIVDVMPKDAEDTRKIMVDTDLDQNEITQILTVVKKYI